MGSDRGDMTLKSAQNWKGQIGPENC